jgi:hypothetical protein
MVIFVVILLAAAIGGVAYWLLGRDDGEDVAAFFTLPTPTVCESGALTITATDGHFAAFTAGRELNESGDKFLLADISLRNDGSAPVRVSEESLYLTERPGEVRRAAALKPGAAPLAVDLAPGDTASGTVAFSIPADVGAAKLVYDDGCTHQEWLVP